MTRIHAQPIRFQIIFARKNEETKIKSSDYYLIIFVTPVDHGIRVFLSWKQADFRLI